MKLSLGVVLVLVGGVVVACSSSDATTPDSTTPPNGTPDAGSGGNSPSDAGPNGPVACAAPPCADGDACVKNADCTSNICTSNRCIPVSCTDRIKNADETDVDCGGSCATKCGPTKTCAGDTDCSDGTCTDTKCVVPTSLDGKANGNETDADCGSSRQGGVTDTKAPACDAGKKCVADVDCKSGGCNFAGVCAFARSCVGQHGGTTCGAGDFTSDAKQHEDCCASAVVDNYTDTVNGYANPVGAAYRLDKFQITAGRIRTFLDAVKGDVQTWVKTNRTKLDPYARAELPTTVEPYLPKGWTQPASTDDCNDGGGGPSYKCNYGALNQISGYRYNDGPGGTYGYGCYMAPGNAGSRTSYLSPAELTALDDGEGGHLVPKERLDEKAVDCVTYPIVAAFCAWDGGHLETLDEYRGAFGGTGDGTGRRYPYADNNEPQVNGVLATRSLGLNDFYGTLLSPTNNWGYTPEAPPAGTDPYSIYNYNLSADHKANLLARLTRANHFWNYFDTIINDQLAWLQGRAESPIAAEQVETLDDQSVAVAPPGRYPSGAGKYGHRDLTGNVMEITGTIGGGPSDFTTSTGVRWTANGSFEGGAHTDSNTMMGYSGFTFAIMTKYGRTGARCARPSGVYPVSATPKGN